MQYDYPQINRFQLIGYMMSDWVFRVKANSEPDHGNVQALFSYEGDTAKRLVRESIQNSLDQALDKDVPVEVRINLNLKDSSINTRNSMFFNGLRFHVEQSLNEATDEGKGNPIEMNQNILSQFDSNMNFLVIEDFKTTGVTGSVKRYTKPRDNEHKALENFYYFFRAEGISGKHGDKMGSWGYGKWVFTMASKINTTFAYSVKQQDNIEPETGVQRLIGFANLWEHGSQDGKRYAPVGYYGKQEHGDDELHSNDRITLPFDDRDETIINEAKTTFGLTRNSDETGLSLVMLMPHDDAITYEELFSSVIQFWFYAIIENKLKVTITNGEQSVTLDNNTLLDEVDNVEWDNMDLQHFSDFPENAEDVKTLINLSEYVHTIDKQNLIKLNIQNITETNDDKDWDNFFTDDELTRYRNRFENEETLVFEVPVFVHEIENNSNTQSYFRLGLQKDTQLQRSQINWVREYLTIPGAGRLNLPTTHVRSFGLVNDPPLQQMLRDSEEPTHYDWKQGEPALKQKYILGSKTVLFVKRSINNIIKQITDTANDDWEDAFISIFSLQQSNQSVGQDDSESGDTRETDQQVPTLERKKDPIRITSLDGGAAEIIALKTFDENEIVDLTFAYDVDHGDAFTDYHPSDFDFTGDSINIDKNKCKFQITGQNTIRILDIQSGMKLRLSGFGTNRDLIVKDDISVT